MVMNARRFAASCALILIAIFSLAFGRPASAQIPYVNMLFNEPRYAAILVDANTGEVLYAKNADSPRYPASITKIMTLYLTFEALASGKLSLSDTVTVSAHAAAQAPTKLGLPVGHTITVDEAIRAIALKSANDMAVALAEKLGGSEARFTTLMTLRAQELGMTNSHFVNASGLPDSRQLSSARDIAILSRSIMRDFPQYYSYFGQRTFTYRGEVIKNHNHLLDSMPGVDGLKTGYTYASGFNLAASAVQEGRRLIAVVMGGSSTATRDNNVQDLLQTGFDVMRRRAHGETVTVAQNLFEPEAAGPVLRPSSEQGDADQAGLKIIVGDGSSERPPAFVRSSDVRSCAIRHSRGRHGRRIATRVCGGAHVTRAADSRHCKKGRHGASRCAAGPSERRLHADARHKSRSSLAQDSGRRGNRRG